MIYLDVSSAVHAKAGLARYAQSLVQGLAPLLGERMCLFQNSLGKLGPLEGWPPERVKGVPYGYKPWRGLVLARQWLRAPMDDLLPDGGLFHATEHLLPPFERIKTVLTVHDLIYERFPRYHKVGNYLYLRAAMPLFCRRADALIAVSEATKADLVGLYGLNPAKITVIHEAAAPRFAPQSAERIAQARQHYHLPERYILAVGTLEPRKNLARLVDACGPLFDDGLADGLVLVGSQGWLNEDFMRHLASSPWKARVIRPGFVADDDLPALYTGALLTAQPSYYEGFGLPVLEAMASGCPVCASNTSSLPEVGGDAARYFHPEDLAEMSATLRRVAEDEALRAEMRRAGLARAARFSWARAAAQTLALYERVLARRMT
jgi:glycosyltransferase involved in cell wall biosynthesis